MMNLNHDKKDVAKLSNSRSLFLLASESCRQTCGENVFEVFALSGNNGFFFIVTGKYGMHAWACPGSHELLYYSGAMKKALLSMVHTTKITIEAL